MPLRLFLTLFSLSLYFLPSFPRRILLDEESSNARNIPDELLFVEDVDSDSFSTFHPISKVYFDSDSSAVCNKFRFQLAQVTVDYAPSSSKKNGKESFMLQTWNLLFLAPEDNSDASKFNIFAFKDVDIQSKTRLKASTSADFQLLDIFWSVYFEAETDSVFDEIESEPSIMGMENVIVFSTREDSLDGDPEYLDSRAISWTSFGFWSEGSSSFGADSTTDFPNVFVLYGTSLGSSVDLEETPILTIFFDDLVPLSIENNGNEISCSATGISIESCVYFEALSDSEVTVAYYKSSGTDIGYRVLSNPLMRGRMEIAINVDSEVNSDFIIVFPFESETNSDFHPLIAMQRNSDSSLLHVSGVPNGNWFGESPFELIPSSSASFSSLYASSTKMEEVYIYSDAFASEVSYLVIPDDYLVGETMNQAKLVVPEHSFGSSSAVILCSEYQFKSANFFAEIVSNGDLGDLTRCFDGIDYQDKHCLFCIYGDSGTDALFIDGKLTISIEDLVLPNDDLYFSSSWVSVVFGDSHQAISVTPYEYAQMLWSSNRISIQTRSIQMKRGTKSGRLRIQFTISNPLPATGSIVLSSFLDDGGANEIETPSNSSFGDFPCFLKVTTGTDEREFSCIFEWAKNSIEVWLEEQEEEMDSGEVVLHLYGLYLPEETSLDEDEQFLQLSIETQNEDGRTIDETLDGEFVTILYEGTSLEEIAVKNVDLAIGNSGWITTLKFDIEITKPVYQGDFIKIVLEGYAHDEESAMGSLECLVFGIDSEKVANSFKTCEVSENNEIYLRTQSDSENYNYALENLEFRVEVSRFLIQDSFEEEEANGVQAYLMYNEDIEGYVSSLVELPLNKFSDDGSTLSLSLDISNAFEGLSADVKVSGELSQGEADHSDYVLVGFYAESLLDLSQVFLYSEDSTIFFSFWDDSTIIFNGFEGSSFTFRVLGLQVSSSMRVQVGLMSPESKGRSSKLYSKGFLAFTMDISSLSALAIVYPHFWSFSTNSAREKATISFSFASPVSDGFFIRLRFLSLFPEIVRNSKSISCKVYDASTSTNLSIGSCLLKGNELTITLKDPLSDGHYYSVSAGSIPNQDWGNCRKETQVQILVYDANFDVKAVSNVLLDDSEENKTGSPESSFELQDADLNLIERDSIEVHAAIGFITLLHISHSQSVFPSDFSFSFEDFSGLLVDGLDDLYKNAKRGLCGHGSAPLPIAVKDSAVESQYPLEISSNSSSVSPAPVILLQFSFERQELEISGGKSEIELTSSVFSRPISICSPMTPSSSHNFDVSLLSNSKELTMTINASSITIGPMEKCAFVLIYPESTSSDASGTLSIREKDSGGVLLFKDSSILVSVMKSSSFISSLSGTFTIISGSLGQIYFGVSASRSSVALIYVAPQVDFLSSMTSFDYAATFYIGANELPGEGQMELVQYDASSIMVEFNGLLCGVQYDYSVFLKGNDQKEVVYQGSFKTDAIRSDGVSFKVVLEENFEEEEMEEVYSKSLCRIPEVLSLPRDEVGNDSGKNCGVDFAQVETKGTTTISFEDSTSTDTTTFSDDNSDSLDFSDSTTLLRSLRFLEYSDSNEIIVRVFPPVRSDSLDLIDYLLSMTETEIKDLLQEYSRFSARISSVKSLSSFTPESLEISGYNGKTVDDSSVTIMDVELSISGVACYSFYPGSDSIGKYAILNGLEGSFSYGCLFVEKPFTFEITGLEPETDYTFAVFARGADTRSYGYTTDVLEIQCTTTIVFGEETEENNGEMVKAVLSLMIGVFLSLGIKWV